MWGDTYVIVCDKNDGEPWIGTSNDAGKVFGPSCFLSSFTIFQKTWERRFMKDMSGLQGWSFVDAVGSLNDPKDFLIQNVGGIWRTRDGGATWKKTAGFWEYRNNNRFFTSHFHSIDTFGVTCTGSGIRCFVIQKKITYAMYSDLEVAFGEVKMEEIHGIKLQFLFQQNTARLRWMI